VPSSFHFLPSSVVGLPYAVGAARAEDVDRLPNPRLKLSACGRRLRRNARGKPSILIAASASRSLSAIR
jgi:hypothetical protein